MSEPVQRDRAWLQQASPAEIANAQRTGELADLAVQGPPSPDPGPTPEGQVSEDGLKTMVPAEITEAFEDGRLDFLLGRTTEVP